MTILSWYAVDASAFYTNIKVHSYKLQIQVVKKENWIHSFNKPSAVQISIFLCTHTSSPLKELLLN